MNMYHCVPIIYSQSTRNLCDNLNICSSNFATHFKYLCLLQFDVDLVRIGRLAKIHADIRPFAAETLTAGFKTVQELEDFYLSKVINRSAHCWLVGF